VLPWLAAFVRRLPDHSLIDRLIRGRAWIPVLGLMLAGIVAMQVEVLKLGATMGRAIEQGSALQSRNELLRDSVASLQDEQRIVRLASGLGMVMPAPGGVGFLRAGNGNAAKAMANIKPPDAAAFAALLSSNGAITQTPTPVTPSTSSTTTPSTQSTSSSATSSSATTQAASTAVATPSTTSSTGTTSTASTAASQGTPAAVAPAATGTSSTNSSTSSSTGSGGAPLSGG
jgi:hypothetical protein